MSANPSTRSPSPWTTVAVRCRRPQLDLVRPVRLDHVGHHDEQRVGVRLAGGEQRLGRLAEPGLVGEQEGAMAAGRGRDDLGLVRHQLRCPGERHRAGLGQRHARGCAALPPARRTGRAARAAPSRRVGGPAWRSARRRPRSRGRGTGSRAGARPRTGAPPGSRRRAPARPVRARAPRAARARRRASRSPCRRARRRRPGRPRRADPAARCRARRSWPAASRRRRAARAPWCACDSVRPASAITRARSSRTSSATTWNLVRTAGRVGGRCTALSTSRATSAEHRDDPLLAGTRVRPR